MKKIITIAFYLGVTALAIHSIYYAITSYIVMEQMNHSWLSQLGMFVIHTSMFKMILAFGFILVLLEMRFSLIIVGLLFVAGVFVKPYFGLRQFVYTPEYAYVPILVALAVLRFRYSGHAKVASAT